MRSVDVAGPRPGFGPRVGDPRAAGQRRRHQVDPRRHPDSAQRLPARASAGASDRRDLPTAAMLNLKECLGEAGVLSAPQSVFLEPESP